MEEYHKAVLSAQCDFFSIFINQLLSQIKTLQLKVCTEDGQLYTSVTNMLSLEGGMSREVNSANA